MMKYTLSMLLLTVSVFAGNAQHYLNGTTKTVPENKIKKLSISEVRKAISFHNITTPNVILEIPFEIKNSSAEKKRYAIETGKRLKKVILTCTIPGEETVKGKFNFEDMHKTLYVPIKIEHLPTTPGESHEYYYFCNASYLEDENGEISYHSTKPAYVPFDGIAGTFTLSKGFF